MNTQKRKLSEFAEPGMGGAEQGVPAPAAEPTQNVIGTHGEPDREGAMAKADLYKLATYSHKLYEQIKDEDQLEAWVQAKITKAADYIASVYHFLEYEMKFSEYGHHLDNSDTLSEGQKMKIKELLAEAKGKMRALKVAQAEKISEGEMGAEGDTPCSACGGTGVEGGQEAAAGPRDVRSMAHPATLAKADAYASKTRAAYAAHKRHEAEEESMEESFGEEETPKERKEREAKEKADDNKPRTSSTGGKIEKIPGGIRHTAKSHVDESFGEETPKERKEREAREKAQDDKPRKSSTGGTITKTKHGLKHTAKSVDESFGEETPKERKEREAREKAEDEAPRKSSTGGTITKTKHGLKHTAKSHDEKVDESKPSAGLSKAKKSAVVKKAKAGGDIGKPGKSFDKVAKSAGGGEKGKKIAAAAMWKNVKETTAYMMEKAKATKDLPGKQEKIDVDHDGKIEKSDLAALRAGKKQTVKESTDFTRMQEQLGRLNRNETHQLVESSEADQIRALTKRLLG